MNQSDAQIADIMRGIYERVEGKEYTFRDDTKALGEFFVSKIIDGIESYEETCRKKAESAKKRAENSSMHCNTFENSSIHSNTLGNLNKSNLNKSNLNKSNLGNSANNPFAELLEEIGGDL